MNLIPNSRNSRYSFRTDIKKRCPEIVRDIVFYISKIYFFFAGSQLNPTPNFLKILRSTSLSITVQ